MSRNQNFVLLVLIICFLAIASAIMMLRESHPCIHQEQSNEKHYEEDGTIPEDKQKFSSDVEKRKRDASGVGIGDDLLINE